MCTVTPLSHLTDHVLHTNKQIASENRTGPKPKDRSDLIGRKVGLNTCVDVLPTGVHREPKIVCTCECGQASSPRPRDFLNGHSKSCRCMKVASFKRFQSGRAENLDAKVCRQLFIDISKPGNNDLTVAAKNGLQDHYVVRAAIDQHKALLLEKFTDAFAHHDGAMTLKERRSLHPIEYAWLKKTVRPVYDHPQTEFEIDWNDTDDDTRAMFSRFIEMSKTVAA